MNTSSLFVVLPEIYLKTNFDDEEDSDDNEK